MKKIVLTKGYFTLVDDEDFDYLNQWKWHTSYYGYAERRQHIKSTRKNQKFKMIRMHRLVMNTPDEMQTDHINGDKLDNRKANLRICTNAQNSANCLMSKNNTSGYKGVIRRPGSKKWLAQIKISYKQHYIGTFNTAIEAARAYNKAALTAWGEYAKLNDC